MKLDNSARSTYVTCKKKFYYEYVLHLKPIHGDPALRYGSVWHRMMDVYYTTVKKFGWNGEITPTDAAIIESSKAWEEETAKFEFDEDTYRNLENLNASFLSYIGTFYNDPYDIKVISVENRFKIPLYSSIVEPIFYTGMIDLLIESGGNWVFDHKTTGSSIYMMRERLHRSAQFMGYVWAARNTYNRVDGAMINFHQISSRKLKDGGWGKVTIDFDRTPQVYTDQDIENWREHTIEVAHQMLRSQEENFYPQNPDSCYNYNRKCPYCIICENTLNLNVEEEVPSGFKKVKPWENFSYDNN